MLKQRVLTALVLMPLVVIGIFALPLPWFALVLGIILLIGSWEFVPLTGLTRRKRGWAIITVQAAVLVGLWAWDALRVVPLHATMFAFCGLWGLLFVRLFQFRPGTRPDVVFQISSVLTSLVVVSVGWFALVNLRALDQGSWHLLMLMLMIWSADSGAFFAGRAFGRRKLAPHLSPGKTWAGLMGGLVCAVLVVQIIAFSFPRFLEAGAALALVTVVTVLASVGGDLLISLHKRVTGVKDAGVIFPGHGGILDRVDSLLAGAPFFLLGIAVFGL